MERYTPEFRRDSVSLVLTSGRPIKEVARELGINDTTLGNWVRAERKGNGLTGTSSAADDAEMQENKRLKRRIVELEKEREILKRATAFWVKESNA